MDAAPDALRAAFDQAGQGQVFRFWDQLDAPAREQLLSDAAEIDLDEVQRLHRDLVQGVEAKALDAEALQPAPYIPHPGQGGDPALWEAATLRGQEALRAGQVAAFTVAGGQGTRLGYNGPKGTFPVTPVRGHTLFQVFAEKILAASRRYQTTLPWLIMTSHANHEATQQAFEAADYFGLDPESVSFFMQGRMPAVDPEGNILLASQQSIAMSPDGHGGSLRALVRSGAIERLKAQGVRAISYFQVDNPLVQSIDPAFLGFHFQQDSEMSSKMIPKAYPLEKVGMFCRQGDKTVVIEYSDMPEALQEATDSAGELRYRAGSIAIHILGVDFVERVGGAGSALPFHKAHKKIPTVDASGAPVQPEGPNGIKFEMFVFDALPLAQNPVIIETLREDEFSPVKNAEGKDSPQTCKEDQLRQFARWANAAGVEVPVDDSGLPAFTFEVSPLFADAAESFAERWERLDPKPALQEGTVLA